MPCAGHDLIMGIIKLFIFKYLVRPRIDESIPRSVISNSTRILNLQCPVSVGPLSRRDKSITVTWSTHVDGVKTPVLNYKNSPYSSEHDGNVIGFDTNDFSLVYNASSITGDSFSMSCKVQYDDLVREPMVKIVLTDPGKVSNYVTRKWSCGSTGVETLDAHIC